MTKLFDRTLINEMSLSNRFIRSATWEGLADKDGSVTPRLIDMMVELVRGEPGLVKRWREGDLRKAECVSDNECFGPALDGRGVYCVTLEKKRNKSVK